VIEARTLWELVEARARATPDGLLALDEKGNELSFAALRERALETAAGLHALGVEADAVVSWLLPTRLSALVLMSALARLGAVQNPLVPIYREREIGFCTAQSGASWLLVPGTYRGVDYGAMARTVARDRDELQVVDIEPELPTGDPAHLPPLETIEAGAPLPVRWIFYTSGTTSDPRGALHTDEGVLFSSRGLAKALDLQPGDRAGVVFPVTHLGGANALTASLLSGSGQVLVETFDPATTIPYLSRNGVTHAGAGVVFYQAYLAARRGADGEAVLPDTRVFYGGGSPKPPTLHGEMRQAFGGEGVLSAYGMTECPIVSLVTTRDPHDKRAATEGRPNGTEIRVVVDGRTAEAGEEGELRVRGPQLMRGYVDASLDAEAFDAEGFFRTGDLGRIDADGYVVVTGRLKDVIIRKGENISALEVESFLFEHPKIADVSVVGLPDTERGELCCAVVVCEAGARLDFEEMFDFLRDRGLMLQKIPERLECLDALPRNPSGKVLKRDLIARFSS
jgi:acyl-CoA synthetase (AMP-forming)/AMP-acid ligase II